MYARAQASQEVRSGRSLRFWWLLALCLLLVGAGGASAAFAAVAAVSNSDPVARDNAYRVKSGHTLERSAPAVLRNDSDPDGDRLIAVRASSPRHGKLDLRRNGSFTYTPNKHFHGTDSFKYSARDGNGGTDTASVKVVVWPILAPPLARPNTYEVAEDRTVSRDAPGVLMNDIEADGRRLLATTVTGPEHGSLTLDPDGSFDYTPEPDFNEEDSFIYRAEDRTGRGDKGTVTIKIDPVNDAPSFTKGPDQSVNEDAGAQSVSPWATGISAGAANESDQNLTFEVTLNSNPGLFAAGPAISENGALTYTPADNENGQATIEVRLKDDGGTDSGGADTSGEQEFGITVNSIDDGPSVSVANNGPVDEGGSATITADATDVDTPGSTFSYEFDCDDDDNFEVGPQPGNTTDCSFDDDGDRVVNVRVNGGEASGSTTVTVNNVAPTADGQSVTTEEDTAKSITLTGTDPAGAADPLSFKITSLPADGALYKGNGTNAADEIQPSDLPQALPSNQVTYQPDENFNGPNAFEFKANDGTVDSAAATVSIQVDAVNDAPTVETESGSASYSEAAQAVEISPLLTVNDFDSTDLASATVSITTGLRSGDTLSFDTQNGISGNYDGGTGVLTLNGTSSVENYQTALRSVRYSSTSNAPGASRTVSFQVDDGGAANNLSNTATRGVSITETNSAPVVTTSSGTTAFTENGPAVAVDDQLTVTDSDSGDLAGATVKISSGFVDGQDGLLFDDQNGITGNASGDTLTLSGSSSVANYQTALRSIRYDNTSDTPDTNQRTVSFQVDDGSSVSNLSNTATKDISVTATNDAPEIDLNGDDAGTGHSATFTEDGPAVSVVDSANLTVTDADDTNIESATVTITNLQDDAESLDADVGATGITKSYDSSTGVLTLGNSATKSQYRQVLRTVTYDNSSQNPGTTGRDVAFVVNDGDDNSNTATSDVAVNGINDAPVLDQPDGTLTYTEDTPSENHALAVAPNLTVDDVDDANLQSGTVQITTNLQTPQDELLFTDQNGISATGSGTGSLTLSGSATEANWQTALRSIQYRNTSDAPDTSQRTVSFRVSDGHTGQSPDSNVVTREIEVVATNDAPIADNETFSGTSEAVGNTSFVVNDLTDGAPDPTGPQKTVTGDILDGDTDPDNAPAELTVKVETRTTADGGSITFQADGDFTYHPPAGCDGGSSDTVQYTVEDNHPTDEKTGNGTLTINISQCVWYVDDSAPAGGDGRSHLPYNSLTPLNNSATDADAAGERIFLYDGTYTGGLALENNQPLFTEKHGLVVGDGGAGNLTLESSDGAGSTLNGGLAAASGNNVQGLNLGTTGSSSVYALSGSSVGSFTMNNATGGDLNNPAGGAINIGGTGNALNLQFGTLSSSGSSGNAVSILNASGTVSGQSGTLSNATGTTVNLNGGPLDFTYGGSVSDDAGQLFSITNKTSGTTDFNGPVDDVTTTPNNGGGFSLQSNGTALTRFDGGLNLSTGSANAISASNGGTLAIPDPAGTATNSIVSTTGTPLNVASTTIHSDDLVFEKISSNGSTNGIVLNNTGTSGNLSVTGNGGVCTIATPTCSGGTIQSTTGDGISLTNTSSPSFQLMRVLNTAGHGISGTTTSGLSLSNSLVQGTGDADNEAGLFFANVNGTNLTGNSSITNTVVNAPADVGAFIQNYGGTLNLTVSGSTFSGTQKNTPGVVTGDDLMRLVADGSPATITASFTNNTFDRSESDGIAASAVSSTGSGGGTLNLTADGNTLTGDNGGSTCPNGCNDNGFQVHATQDGTIRFTIQNNNIQNQRNEAIAVVSDNTADVQGTIQNNTIGSAATAGSGSLFEQGIFLAPDDNADLVARVHNNFIRSTLEEGIWAEANDGSGGTPTMDVTLTNNNTPTPADTSGTVFGSLEVWSTTAAITCAKVENNTAATGVSAGGSIELLQANTATFKIEGLPAPTNVASGYVAGKNPASAPPINAIAVGSPFTGGTCRTPAATPTP